MPTRFDTFDNSPIKSEFRHEKLHQTEPSWISQTQPQNPKIKFDNEPMNYDEFKSRCVLDVLWGQPIKLVQVASTSELLENQRNVLGLFKITPSHFCRASEASKIKYEKVGPKILIHL